ncbi:carboxymuconolactone decarboxylase family protein [Humibacter sp. RRB41]|uniref:carboxymuconolactone decarboxylase family protein n=1 Tax=Humibacter sp. RRB41 TaxID=2919946 RepID=UPI001FA96C13|nr:carboxymuconolactone decarboxylase family protein [Humibacter sp. RRB41]
MRLPEIDRGDTLKHRVLIAMISRVSGLRLPDAARVAFYHQDFAGPVLGAWTQQTMRGPSGWSISERELMAAAVAAWNSCPFCVGAHGAIAVRGIDRRTVNAVLNDYQTAPVTDRLKAALTFNDKLTRTPNTLSAADAHTALDAGLTVADLRDAAAVASIFNIITRYANALGFQIPSDDDFDKSADMLIKRGYA